MVLSCRRAGSCTGLHGNLPVTHEHFRGSTNQHAIPNRRTSAKEKEILLMWCTTIWRTTSRDLHLDIVGRPVKKVRLESLRMHIKQTKWIVANIQTDSLSRRKRTSDSSEIGSRLYI